MDGIFFIAPIDGISFEASEHKSLRMEASGAEDAHE